MFRFKIKSLNWKYILGEILLIFLGINLAIWFNNWNTNRQLDEDKQQAVQRIEEEIRSNMEELIRAREINMNIGPAIEAFRKMQAPDLTGALVSYDEMAEFQNKFPTFFRKKDSVAMGDGRYHYMGDTFINLELAELTEIAWETTKDLGLANEFGFDCLYELENMYNVQRLVQNEINKSAEALQTSDISRLVRVLEFLGQLDAQLERDYNNMLENIQNCS